MLDGGLSIGEGAFFGAFNYYTRRLTPLQTGAFSQGAYFNAYQWPAFARKTPLGSDISRIYTPPKRSASLPPQVEMFAARSPCQDDFNRQHERFEAAYQLARADCSFQVVSPSPIHSRATTGHYSMYLRLRRLSLS